MDPIRLALNFSFILFCIPPRYFDHIFDRDTQDEATSG